MRVGMNTGKSREPGKAMPLCVTEKGQKRKSPILSAVVIGGS